MRKAQLHPGSVLRVRGPWFILACAVAAGLAPCAGAAEDAALLAARLARLERQLEAKGLVDLLQQVEDLQQEVRRLQGELENQAHALEQVRKTQRDTYADLDQRLATLAPGGGAAAGGLAPPPHVPVEPPLPMTSAPAGVNVAGAPSEQGMALDFETSSIGPRLGDSAADVQAAAAAADLQAAAAARPDGAINPAPTDFPGAEPAMDAPLYDRAGAPAPGVAPPMTQPGPPAFPAPATPPNLAPRAPTVDSPESEAAYRDAFTLLKAGQYEQAIAAFSSYLQQYPASQYNDNAQYWLGEAYYVMRQFEPAIEQYQKVVNNYPDSQKQSHAMLKIAYSYDKLGFADQAAKVLMDLKQRFPGSVAARLADESLQRMRAAAP